MAIIRVGYVKPVANLLMIAGEMTALTKELRQKTAELKAFYKTTDNSKGEKHE